MKKFLERIAAILLGALIIFNLFNLVYYQLTKDSRIVAFEVYDALDLAEKNTGYTKLVLGDSVARQIFPPSHQDRYDDVCFLATNQAIMTTGNYILLERFMENNPQLTEVYYIVRPDSLMSQINFHYTFSYFITPMYEEPFVQYLDEKTRERFEYTFGKEFIESSYVKWLFAKYPKLLDIYHDNRQIILQMPWKKSDSFEENMAVLYIQQMKEACESRHITFHLLSPPLPESFSFYSQQMQSTFALFGNDEMYHEYENSMLYFEDRNFQDGIHMDNLFLNGIREELQTHLLNQNNLQNPGTVAGAVAKVDG